MSSKEPTRIIEIDQQVLRPSDPFLKGFVSVYQNAAGRLLGEQNVRPRQEFQILAKAAQTILPMPEVRTLADMNSIDEQYGALVEAVLLFCGIDIMADDIAENALTEEEKRFMKVFFEIIKKYFEASSKVNISTLDKREFILSLSHDVASLSPDIAPPMPHLRDIVGLDDHSPQMKYVMATLNLIDQMFERVDKLRGCHTENVRDALCYQFSEMLKTCEFSARFRELLHAGDIEEICKMAPTSEDFLLQTAGGMGTGLMVAMGSTLLHEQDAYKLLPLADRIAMLGRIPNELVAANEIKKGDPNFFVYRALRQGTPKLRQEIITLAKLPSGEEKEKLFERLLPSILTEDAIKELLMLYEGRMKDLKTYPFPSALNVNGSFVPGLERFFDIEHSRSQLQFNRYPEGALITSLVEKMKERIKKAITV